MLTMLRLIEDLKKSLKDSLKAKRKADEIILKEYKDYLKIQRKKYRITKL